MRKVFVLLVVIVFGFLLFYLWYGFIKPDSFFTAQFGVAANLKYIWIPRLLIPPVFVIILFIFLSKNSKYVKNFLITVSAILILGLILYPILDIRSFLKSLSRNTIIKKEYHPYLQLTPYSICCFDSISEINSLEIFCLGGSTTEFEDSKGVGWPDMLQKELRKFYNSDSIYVFNFGRQWYTTLHSLINYEANLRHYKPDVIILMHNINDLLHNADFSYLSKGDFRGDYGHFMGPSVNIFENQGFFGQYWTNVRKVWHNKQRAIIDQDSFPGLNSFERNINTLIDLALMDSTRIILLTQPNIYNENMGDKEKDACIMVNFEAVGKDKRWSFQTAYEGMRQYNDKISEIAGKRKVYFIDLEKHIPKSLDYFTDEVHYTDTTFSIISNFLAEEIFRLKIIRP